MRLAIFLVLVAISAAVALRQGADDEMHPTVNIKKRATKLRAVDVKERTASFWTSSAQDILTKKIASQPNTDVARNVIMFLGDGMSIPTLAAARAYTGDISNQLSFENFPYTALSKTYCVDAQTADSACSATAYLCGVKGNIETIGVTAAVELNDCDAMADEANHVSSIAAWSQAAGKKTGIVTTSYITDASPSGAYAHAANRQWQTDAVILEANGDPTKCRDITYQLVKSEPGKNFNVILGGGSKVFINTTMTDPLGVVGTRTDGLNLIEEWLNDKTDAGQKAEYVWDRNTLLNLSESTDSVLGLFSSKYMPYNLDRDPLLVPSLEEMTEVAINIVSKDAENGYFLFIEGGRIDHGHHASLARKALDETAEFSKAVSKALEMTNEKDTLIVVTSDHAHTMSMSGYPPRGNPIFGPIEKDDNGITRLTINYANGPGYGSDPDSDTNDKSYAFPSVNKLSSESHGGDDVGVFARGPWAHLFSGVFEQNTIPHIMAYASCVGDGLTACSTNSAASLTVVTLVNLPLLLAFLLLGNLL